MKKRIPAVNEALEEVRDAIKQVQSTNEDYRNADVEKEFLAAIEKEIRIYNVLENLQLYMARLCLQDKDVAEVLVKVKLVRKKDLAILSDKEEETKLQAALDELSAALEETRALLARPGESTRFVC